MDYGDGASAAGLLSNFLNQYQQAKREKREGEMSAEERALKKRMMQAQMLQSGLRENEAGGFEFTPEAQADRDADLNYKKAQTAKLLAEARGGGVGGFKNPVDQLNYQLKQNELEQQKRGKTLPAETAAKLGSFLGAADSSAKIEGLAGTKETGKWEATKDWFKELVGMQDTDRAKFTADVGSQRNEVMNRIAGANVTPDERSRIEEGIPTRRDAPEQFQGKAVSTTDNLIKKAESEIAALEAAGYDTAAMKESLAKSIATVQSVRSKKQKTADESGGGLIDEANAAGPEQKDPEAENYAKAHNLPYATAKKVLDGRRAKKAK